MNNDIVMDPVALPKLLTLRHPEQRWLCPLETSLFLSQRGTMTDKIDGSIWNKDQEFYLCAMARYPDLLG